MRRLVWLLCVWAVSLLPQSGHGHGFQPQVVGLTISRVSPTAVHALTNNQGVFADLSGTYRWICEDAVYPFAKTQGLALFGEREERWLVATNHGMHRSSDGGCDFEAVDHEVGTLRLGGLWRQPQGDALITVSTLPDVSNRVFRSDDEGQTWTTLSLDVEGELLGVHFLSSADPRFLIHTDQAMYVSRAGDDAFDSLVVRTEQLNVPPEQVLRIAVSPTDEQWMLAVVAAGERARAVLSEDGGATWRDVALFSEPQISLIFSVTGQEAIAVGLLGARWRSADSGRTWVPDGSGPVELKCLARGEGGALYGCSNPNSGGPWVIGQSADFGRTWVPVLGRFEDAVHRKDCADTGRTVLCCRGRCPGDDLMCGQPLNVEWPPECYDGVPPELLPDQGVPDGAVQPTDAGQMGAVDGEVMPSSDGAHRVTDGGGFTGDRGRSGSPDAGQSMTSGSSGGCVASGGDPGGPNTLLFICLLASMCRRPLHR